MTLLHVCCGPCATYPAKVLEEKGIEFDAFFYNPNIHPYTEFEKRKLTAVKWAEKADVRLVIFENNYEGPWIQNELSKNDRCKMCYEIRISRVCSYAKDNGYTSVSSTLLVSPYQNHQLIIDIFKKYTEKLGLQFTYFDFRTGYRRGQEFAKEMGLYRQKYCGCLPSIEESAYMLKRKQIG